MFSKLLTEPLLLRRLVKAQERQAEALERLLRIAEYNFGTGTVLEDYNSDGEGDIEYATDRRSWEIAEQDSRRPVPVEAEDLPRPFRG